MMRTGQVGDWTSLFSTVDRLGLGGNCNCTMCSMHMNKLQKASNKEETGLK